LFSIFFTSSKAPSQKQKQKRLYGAEGTVVFDFKEQLWSQHSDYDAQGNSASKMQNNRLADFKNSQMADRKPSC